MDGFELVGEKFELIRAILLFESFVKILRPISEGSKVCPHAFSSLVVSEMCVV